MQHKNLKSVLGIACVASLAFGALTAMPANAAGPDGIEKAIAAADNAVKAQHSLQSVDGLEVKRVGADKGDSQSKLFYVNYERTLQGKRVVGGGAVVVARGNGNVTDISLPKHGTLPRTVESSISAEQAETAAKALLSRVDNSTKAELVVYAWDMPTPVSAYFVKVSGVRQEEGRTVPSIQDVYVDAKTGKVIVSDEIIKEVSGTGNYNGKVDIDVSGGKMVSNTAKGLECRTDNRTMTFTGNPGNGGAKDYLTACVDIVYAAEQEKKMLTDWLGRDGMDGRGGWVPAYADLDEANAFYQGSSTNFGHNSKNTARLTSIDVVAHEYGHGIHTHTGSGENGGIGETYGDIFGALTEAYANNAKDRPDYTVGEMVDFRGDGKSIRYMYNPELAPNDGTSRHPVHPNCYSDKLERGYEVHAAAGPWNHFFYLLAEGSNPGGGKPESPTCNKSTVQGIGVKDAGRVAYGALQRHNSRGYGIFRSYALAAAKDLFTDDNCAKFNKTKAALDGAGFPAVNGEATCTSSSNPTTKPNPTKPGVDKDELSSGQSVSFDLGAGKSVKKFVSIPANARSLVVKLSADNGDADLYVSQGSEATEDHYDCRPWLSDSNETCSIDRPKQGKTFIMVSAAESVSNLTLVATWK